MHDSTGADGTDTLLNIEHAGFENFGGNLNDLTPAIHRFFNTNNGTHFFTANNDEAAYIIETGDLTYEGVAFYTEAA